MSAKKPSREIVEQVLGEIAEHLAEIEAALLRLDDDPGRLDEIGELFRRMHTIKGIAAAVDRPAIPEIAHRAETLLESVRSSGAPLAPEELDLLLHARDLLGKALVGEEVDPVPFAKRIEARFGEAPPSSPPATLPESAGEESEPEEESKEVFLLFRAGGTLCALPVERVREISQVLPWRKVPFTDASFRGMASLRGQLVPVLDLAALLGLPSPEEGTRTLFLECGDELVGLLVDRALGVATLPGWERSAPALRHLGVEAVEAVGAYHGEVVSILSAERLVRLVEA